MSKVIKVVATYTNRHTGASEQTSAEVYQTLMLMTQLNTITTRREMYLRAGALVDTRVVITGWLNVPVTIDAPALADDERDGEGGRG